LTVPRPTDAGKCKSQIQLHARIQTQNQQSPPDVVVERLKEVVDMLAAVGAKVRHQKVGIVERQQVIVNVANTRITQIVPTVANVETWQFTITRLVLHID